MFDSRTKARYLAFLFIGGGLVGALTLAFPHSAEVSDGPLLLIVGAAVLVALVALRLAPTMSDDAVHAVLAAGTVLLTLATHFTDQGVPYPIIFIWPALYAFYFFRVRTALAHLAFVGICYASILIIDDEMDVAVRLVLVLGTPLVVGLLISRLLGTLRVALERSDRHAESLRISEQRTRHMIDRAKDAFVSTDAEGRILDVNAAAEAMFGRSRREMIGQRFPEISIPAEHREDFERRRRALLSKAGDTGTAHVGLRVSLDRPDGSRVDAEAMIWAVEAEGGWTFSARLTDIGDRLQRAEAREQIVRAEAARAEAERAAARIARLQRVVDTALSRRDLDSLLPALLRRAREVLDADAGALLLLEDRELWLRASDGVVTTGRPERAARGAGLAGRVLAEDAAIRVTGAEAAALADPAVIAAGITSLIGMPLAARGTTIGVLELGVRDRQFTQEDLHLLRLAADRVALAIDYARAYGREHRIAETLQRSLLPEHLPDVPGAALTARYLPAAAESEIGGDWYDAIPLAGARVLLVMGDVSGKGLEAASALGTLRNAIRAYALDGYGPADIAERLNRFVLADTARDHMATVVLVDFDPIGARLTWVNAGHPPPLVLDAHGCARFLEGARGVPLGVLPFPGYVEQTAALDAGGAFVLYTDGLVERRGEHIDIGLGKVAAAASAGPLEPAALCDRLLAAALPDGATSDDVALLVLCHAPLGHELAFVLPGEPSALRSLRALMRRWLAQIEAGTDDVHAITLACSEACTNAIEHAAAAPGATISVEARLRGGEIEISIRDHGRWRTDAPPGNHGRGLELMTALMDEVAVHTSTVGTAVHLRRRLHQSVSAT